MMLILSVTLSPFVCHPNNGIAAYRDIGIAAYRDTGIATNEAFISLYAQ